MTEMLRFNKGKVDLTMRSWISDTIESLIFMFGSIKYKRDNWKNGKQTLEETMLNLMKSAKRHIQHYESGEWLDPESKMPHLGHAIWNLNRMLDFHYLGLNHSKGGKDLYHQPLQHELPDVPQLETFEEVYGFKPLVLQEREAEPQINDVLGKPIREVGLQVGDVTFDVGWFYHITGLDDNMVAYEYWSTNSKRRFVHSDIEIGEFEGDILIHREGLDND